MKNIGIPLFTLAAILAAAPAAQAGVREAAVEKVVESYLPGVTGFGKLGVKKLIVNDKKRTVTVTLTDAGADIPLTPEMVEQLKSDCLKALGSKYANDYYANGLTAAGDSANSTAKIMTILGFCIAALGLIYTIVMFATGSFSAMVNMMESL